MGKTAYTFGITLRLPVHEARSLVEAALRAEGFGVLTEIDVAARMLAKLGVERSSYLILGACNPSLAHRALQADPSIGTLLPRNGTTDILRSGQDMASGIAVLNGRVIAVGEARDGSASKPGEPAVWIGPGH